MPVESNATGRKTPRPSTDTGETADGRTGPRIGSLFSGAGGLDMAVEAVFGGQVVWHSEIDPAASKVLAHHWPDVPNLGDISQINWRNWKPMLEVDILCGGFPCTDVSAAGKRAGMHGTRSGLWSQMAEAIDVLRPKFVVIENVRGLLNADANRPLESNEVGVGDGSDRPVLRAIGAVLGDLADIGTYDARWVTVAASSVGAPHRRERVFIVATHTHTRCRPLEQRMGQRAGRTSAAAAAT
jgi:DNA (cytosine-5)-methyltransferase 1